MNKIDNRKRNIFIIGAGSVIDWKGTSTPELTKKILNSGFYAKDNKRITLHIYNSLLKNKYDKYEINFETIINVIEEFIVYFSTFNANKDKHSLLFTFLKETALLDNLLNFSIIGDPKSSNYSLDILNSEYYKSKTPEDNVNPNQFFFQLLLEDLLTQIVYEVDKYSRYTRNRKIVESKCNTDLNEAFSKWIKSIIHKNEIVRLYTLNYDRLFKIILENRGIPVFEGFKSSAFLNPSEQPIPPDLVNIINDTNSTCCYNLHGCTSWCVRKIGISETFHFFLRAISEKPSNNSHTPIFQIEKGKNIVLTNIIAGYQKAQRSAISPYKQMQSSFDRDCINANCLNIIGYSFGDEHINESIRTAILFNSNLRINIIDPYYSKNIDLIFRRKFLSLLPKKLDYLKINDKIMRIKNTTIYEYDFKDFLLHEHYKI